MPSSAISGLTAQELLDRRRAQNKLAQRRFREKAKLARKSTAAAATAAAVKQSQSQTPYPSHHQLLSTGQPSLKSVPIPSQGVSSQATLPIDSSLLFGPNLSCMPPTSDAWFPSQTCISLETASLLLQNIDLDQSKPSVNSNTAYTTLAGASLESASMASLSSFHVTPLSKLPDPDSSSLYLGTSLYPEFQHPLTQCIDTASLTTSSNFAAPNPIAASTIATTSPSSPSSSSSSSSPSLSPPTLTTPISTNILTLEPNSSAQGFSLPSTYLQASSCLTPDADQFYAAVADALAQTSSEPDSDSEPSIRPLTSSSNKYPSQATLLLNDASQSRFSSLGQPVRVESQPFSLPADKPSSNGLLLHHADLDPNSPASSSSLSSITTRYGSSSFPTLTDFSSNPSTSSSPLTEIMMSPEFTAMDIGNALESRSGPKHFNQIIQNFIKTIATAIPPPTTLVPKFSMQSFSFGRAIISNTIKMGFNKLVMQDCGAKSYIAESWELWKTERRLKEAEGLGWTSALTSHVQARPMADQDKEVDQIVNEVTARILENDMKANDLDNGVEPHTQIVSGLCPMSGKPPGSSQFELIDKRLNWENIPENMLPTKEQLVYTHHAYLDTAFPWPSVRSRILILAASGEISEEELCLDLLYTAFVPNKPTCFYIWGDDPMDPEAWEIDQDFALKWWGLFDDRVIQRTNWWRRQRGLSDLIVPIPRVDANRNESRGLGTGSKYGLGWTEPTLRSSFMIK